MSALGSASSWVLGLHGGALITVVLSLPYVLATTGEDTERRIFRRRALGVYALALLTAGAILTIASAMF